MKHTPVNIRNWQILLVMHVKKYRKNNLLKMCGPQIRLWLFTFRPIASKQLNIYLDYNRYSQLTRWCSFIASAMGARGPGSIPGSGKCLYVWLFCFVVVFLLFVLNTLFFTKFAIPFAMLIYLAYLSYWKMCDWL